jgi:hypothetical protein
MLERHKAAQKIEVRVPASDLVWNTVIYLLLFPAYLTESRASHFRGQVEVFAGRDGEHGVESRHPISRDAATDTDPAAKRTTASSRDRSERTSHVSIRLAVFFKVFFELAVSVAICFLQVALGLSIH